MATLPAVIRTTANRTNGVSYFQAVGAEHDVRNRADFDGAYVEITFRAASNPPVLAIATGSA